MINATYIYTTFTNIADPTIEYNLTYPLTERVMHDILDNQKNINIEYSDIPIKIILAYIKYCKVEKNPDWKTFHEKFCNNIIDSIKTEYVFLTLGNPWEVLFLASLLKANKKVVVGGPTTKSYDLETLRELFVVNGATNLHNLMIVRPYINKDFNFYNAIKEWKDIDLDIKFDTTNFFNNTGIHKFYKEYKKYLLSLDIKLNRYPIMFQTKCQWGKCSFCKYSTNKPNYFINENNVEEVAYSVIKEMKFYNIYVLSIHDPEFYFTDLQKRFLDIIKTTNIKILFFTSVRLLNNEKHFEYIKKYSDIIGALIIGFETFDDFSLKYINKGVTSEDNFNVIHKLMDLNKKLKNPIHLSNLFMSNLVTNNKESIIKNYDLVYKFKKLLENNNMPNNFSYSNFNVNPLTKYNNSKYIRLKKHSLNVLNEYERIDENGNILPEDKDIIDPKIYNELIPDIRW